MTPACGLVIFGDVAFQAKPMPPKRVHVEVHVFERVARHRLTQTFMNEGEPKTEVAYVFPLVDGVSISAFRVRFSHGRQIVGEVREKDEARLAFQDAARRGLRAACLEENSADVFRTSIGGLGSGEEVEIKLEYCLELPLADSAVRLTIPSHVSPRYRPLQGSTPDEVLCHDAIREYSSTLPGAAFTAEISVNMATGVAAIESPTHSFQVLQISEASEAHAAIGTAGLQNDVVVMIRPRALFEPVVVREVLSARGTEALMLSLVPQFDAPPQRLEAVFVLDCSGSMGGLRMKQAKRATSIFLCSLPADCFFNVILFGSTFDALHGGGSVAYSQASLQEASGFVDKASANLGGTELLKPLDFVLKKPRPQGIQRAVFLLTDGQVSNQQQVISLVRSGGCRIFAIGIGSGVSTALVNGVARASQGSAAFVQDHEKLEPVCVSMLRKAASPSVSNVTVSWPKTSAFRSQTRLPAIFAGDALSGFALFPRGTPELADGAVVKVTGDIPSGRLELVVAVPTSARSVDDEQDALLHRLYARSVIRDVEEAEDSAQGACRVDAIQLSILYSVLCSYTAFLSVEQVDGGRLERSAEIAKAGRQHFAGPKGGRQHFAGPKGGQSPFYYGSRQAWSEIDSLSHTLDDLVTSRSLSTESVQFYRMASRSERWIGFGGLLSSLMRLGCRAAIGMSGLTSVALRRFRRQEKLVATMAVPIAVASGPAASRSVADAITAPSSSGLPIPRTRCGGQQAASGVERVAAILRLARFDGSFAHSPELQHLTGIKESATLAWADQQWDRPVPVDVMVTACVLAHLAQEFGGEEATWQLLAAKAEAWLRMQHSAWTSSSIKTVDQLVAVATAWVRAPQVGSERVWQLV
eukprot:CAMPEP_0117484554 /NCGR_PEP_ID=MMETSP0784-20121206/14515_1 /TAXON_ID=39447 /ORGANISM="" /LENGTH=867 /DNA_ID=CAMNT_0005279125 /DNA_START=83 /DNA_END=2686 /DNA_ORIENTATION=-